MEADVYARDASTVLKVYRRPDVLPDLRALQRFYETLDGRALPFALPRIIAIEVEDGCVATVERRIDGAPMAALLPGIAPARLDALIAATFDALLHMRSVRLTSPLGRRKLFDTAGISATNDWHAFLRRFIAEASARLAPFFGRDVWDWDAKRARITRQFSRPYAGTEALIHGDVFPGNLLMVDRRLTGVIDFGIMTMWGDPLWDIATCCAFFDMYDELGLDARERCFRAATHRLGNVLPMLHRYILVYSIVGADAYDPTCADAHYRWCVANLNNASLWL